MYRFLECTAGQYMTSAVRTVRRDTTLRELEALFAEQDFNSFPVVEDGKLAGLVTKFDFLRAFAFTTDQLVPHYDELMQRRVAEVMTSTVVHVEAAAPAAEQWREPCRRARLGSSSSSAGRRCLESRTTGTPRRCPPPECGE